MSTFSLVFCVPPRNRPAAEVDDIAEEAFGDAPTANAEAIDATTIAENTAATLEADLEGLLDAAGVLDEIAGDDVGHAFSSGAEIFWIQCGCECKLTKRRKTK